MLTIMQLKLKLITFFCKLKNLPYCRPRHIHGNYKFHFQHLLVSIKKKVFLKKPKKKKIKQYKSNFKNETYTDIRDLVIKN